mgnify:CR=1 FL=1
MNLIAYSVIMATYYFQIPFTLTLRLWDIFILEGEKILTAMAYNIIKLHRSMSSLEKRVYKHESYDPILKSLKS